MQYKTDETDVQSGTDACQQPWVGFDYTALDLPEFMHSPVFRRFVETLNHMAWGIATEMFVTVLARHPIEKMKAFEMHIRKMSDRDIGESLGVDHKTAKRWYEEVKATMREISPLGRSGTQENAANLKNPCPTKAHLQEKL